MKRMKILKTVGAFTIALAMLVACKKQDDLFKAFNPDRMFMPSGAIGAESGETEVKLTWKEALNTNAKPTYTVEISQDSLFENGALFALQTDTTGIVLTDQQLEVREKYFARVRTDETNSTPASNWLYGNGFIIRGKQLFMAINEQTDLKDTYVILNWRHDETVTQLHIAEFEEGADVGQIVQRIDLDAQAVEEATIRVENLKPKTTYAAILRAGSVQVGSIGFTTKEPSDFTVEVTPDDDLEEVIAAAADQDVIGLHPGTYVLTENIITILMKHITLASVSGNPAETIIQVRGFELRGDGSGIHLYDLTVDMLGVEGLYLVDLQGGATMYTSIHVQGCHIQGIGRAFVRGSRAGNREHRIDYIRVENSIVEDNDQDYALFELQKLEMNRFELVNSTFNRLSTNILRYDTNIGTPGASILIDHCTINAFGNTGNRRPLMDVNTPADIVISNSILANTGWISPRFSSLSMSNDLLRAGNGASAEIRNTNVYNLMNAATPPAPLNIPSSVVVTNVLTETLTWDFNTSDFTLPTNSPLREASSSAGPIGDPRWAR